MVEKIKETTDIQIVAVIAVVDRYEKGMENVHERGTKTLAEKYGCKVLTVVNGDEITQAIRQGLV